VTEVVRVTLEETPDDNSTHWIRRMLGDRFWIGKDTVAQIRRSHTSSLGSWTGLSAQ